MSRKIQPCFSVLFFFVKERISPTEVDETFMYIRAISAPVCGDSLVTCNPVLFLSFSAEGHCY